MQDNITRIYHREAGGSFDAGRSATGWVVNQAIVEGDLFVCFEGGDLYRYTPDTERPSVETILPGREVPFALAGMKRQVYAIVSSRCARKLATSTASMPSSISASFDPGHAPLSLVLYDGLSWHAIAPIPVGASPDRLRQLPPRLHVINDKLTLVMPQTANDKLTIYQFEVDRRDWIARTPQTLAPLENYWLLTVARIPALVAVMTRPDGSPDVLFLRLTPSADTLGDESPQPTNLQYSSVPETAKIVEISDAAGFNQHLCLLVRDQERNLFLRFANPNQRPAETTIDIARLLTDQYVTQRNQAIIRLTTFLLLAAVMVGLFVFRRESMMRQLDLPPGVTLATNSRRLVAMLIDFLPIIIATGYVTHFPWLDGLRSLLRWGIGPDDPTASLNMKLLMWWGISILIYAVYCLTMELISGRTFGKMLLNLSVLSETGAKPSSGQIFVRSITRLIELLPQFWVFVLLVPLSRNRQRMGDIFARSIVVKGTAKPLDTPVDSETRNPDDEAPPDQNVQ